MNPLALKEMALKLRDLKDNAKESFEEKELLHISEDSKAYVAWKTDMSTKLQEIYNFAKNNNLPCKADFDELLEEMISRITSEVEDQYNEDYSEEISNEYDEE